MHAFHRNQDILNALFKLLICDWILVNDRNVTLGQLHFLGPANSHTHTLSMHCCNTRLSCLVCFSRADFADHVKPRLRQWDPWRALDGRYGSDIHPCVSEMSHSPSRLSGRSRNSERGFPLIVDPRRRGFFKMYAI